MDDLWWSLSVFVTVTNSSFSLNLFFRVISLSTKPRKNCLRTYLRLCLRFYLRFSASQTTNIFNNCFNLFTIFIAQIRFWRAYMVKYIKLYHLRLLSYSNAEVVTKLSHKNTHHWWKLSIFQFFTHKSKIFNGEKKTGKGNQ